MNDKLRHLSEPSKPPSNRVLEAAENPFLLRVTDQETARVVAVHRSNGRIVGAGCLLDSTHILTCWHVVDAALRPEAPDMGKSVFVTLAGVTYQPTILAELEHGNYEGLEGTEYDVALLKILDTPKLTIPPAEFASPLRHSGKTYSVLGFPSGDPQGRNVTGRLHAADAKGLVQMDRGGALSVLGGFSGAPVWSSDLNAFVGIVVTELANKGVSWCIPSRQLCSLYSDLRVRFRIPPMDRPVIHDYSVDDPNVDLFGKVSENDERRLSATVTKHRDSYDVKVVYECLKGSPPRGHFVTFITYPDFEQDGEDAYELFAEVQVRDSLSWCAEQEFQPKELFTVAVIGDAGDTVLTLNLEEEFKRRQLRK